MPVRVDWRQSLSSLDSSEGGTIPDFCEEPSCGTLLDCGGLARSFIFRKIVGIWNCVLPAKRLVLRRKADLFVPLSHFRRHVIIISLKYVYETVRLIVSGRLVPSIYCYKNVEAELGITCLVHHRCWRAVTKVALMPHASLLSATVITTASIRLIWVYIDNLRPPVCLVLIGYIRRKNGRPH